MAASDKPKRSAVKAGQRSGPPASVKGQNVSRVAGGATSNAPRHVAVKPRRVPLYFYLLLGLLVVVGGFVLYTFLSGNNQRRTGDAPFTAQQVADQGISRGSATAKVVFVEFGDFQCPGCYDFAVQAEPDFKATYVDTNQVREVWMDYPLASLHPKAMKAAEAGQCANAQGKFWQFHDALYANQDAWVNGNEDTLWKQYAQQVGIDGDKLMQCVQANKYDAQIQATIKAGDSEKVQGTPSFLINHVLLFGVGPDELDKAIASEAIR